MELLTLFFVVGMFLAALCVTLIVRRDFLSRKEDFQRDHPPQLPRKIRTR